MVTLLPVSKISGVDKNGDGVFESKSGAGGFVGMVAAARKDSVDGGETRCAVVFDLEGIGRSFVSAYLGFYGEAQDWAHLGTYETHGFRSAGRTATLNDLTISNRLWGPLSCCLFTWTQVRSCNRSSHSARATLASRSATSSPKVESLYGERS